MFEMIKIVKLKKYLKYKIVDKRELPQVNEIIKI
jgi:hypothetical protein